MHTFNCGDNKSTDIDSERARKKNEGSSDERLNTVTCNAGK